jgi:hypothetical protein
MVTTDGWGSIKPSIPVDFPLSSQFLRGGNRMNAPMMRRKNHDGEVN